MASIGDLGGDTASAWAHSAPCTRATVWRPPISLSWQRGDPRLAVHTPGRMLADMLSAATLQIGESGVVEDVGGADATALRLLEMGLVSGTVVTLLKKAPTGDPLQFRVRGFHLSLRRAEAARIRIVEVGE